MTKFSADFKQFVFDNRGEVIQSVSGRVYLNRPGCFRWETTAPYRQLILTDGVGLYVFDEDLEQITFQTLDNSSGGVPALILSEKPAFLKNIFNVVEEENDLNQRVFALTPKNDQSLFRQIRLTFDSLRLLGLELIDHFDHATRIKFTNSTVEPMLESSMFKFVIPEGIDVIGDVPTRDSPC